MSGLAPSRCLRSIFGSARTVILAGSGMRPGRSSTVTPKGGPDLCGQHLEAQQAVQPQQPGEAAPAPEEERRLLAADGHHGHDRHVVLDASLTKPVRPAKSISADSQVGR